MEERQEKMDDKLNDVLIKAETLIEALPYIRHTFRNTTTR